MFGTRYFNGCLTRTIPVCAIEFPKKNLLKEFQYSSSSKGHPDFVNMNDSKACKFINDIAPRLDEDKKTLLRKVFVKHPKLMNMNHEWSSEIIESYLKTLSNLMVMVTGTTPATMNSSTVKRIELLIKLLEQYDLDSTFTSDMRKIVSEAWTYHSHKQDLHKRAEELRAELQTLDDKLKQGKSSIYPI